MTYQPIPGQSHHPSEEETMSVIRSVLTEAEEPAPSRKALRAAQKAQKMSAAPMPAPAPDPKTETSRAFVEPTVDRTVRRRASDLPELEEWSDSSAPAPRGNRIGKVTALARGHVEPAFAALRNFRPSTRHLAIVSMALLVVVRPHWFVISGVLIVALIVGSFLILGSDRIWRGVLAWLNHVDRRDPERAMHMRVRLDRFACRWDAILDFFPDGMVDGLYMPDLQAMQNADEAHTKAMAARLDRMVHDN